MVIPTLRYFLRGTNEYGERFPYTVNIKFDERICAFVPNVKYLMKWLFQPLRKKRKHFFAFVPKNSQFYFFCGAYVCHIQKGKKYFEKDE